MFGMVANLEQIPTQEKKIEKVIDFESIRNPEVQHVLVKEALLKMGPVFKDAGDGYRIIASTAMFMNSYELGVPDLREKTSPPGDLDVSILNVETADMILGRLKEVPGVKFIDEESGEFVEYSGEGELSMRRINGEETFKIECIVPIMFTEKMLEAMKEGSPDEDFSLWEERVGVVVEYPAEFFLNSRFDTEDYSHTKIPIVAEDGGKYMYNIMDAPSLKKFYINVEDFESKQFKLYNEWYNILLNRDIRRVLLSRLGDFSIDESKLPYPEPRQLEIKDYRNWEVKNYKVTEEEANEIVDGVFERFPGEEIENVKNFYLVMSQGYTQYKADRLAMKALLGAKEKINKRVEDIVSLESID